MIAKMTERRKHPTELYLDKIVDAIGIGEGLGQDAYGVCVNLLYSLYYDGYVMGKEEGKDIGARQEKLRKMGYRTFVCHYCGETKHDFEVEETKGNIFCLLWQECGRPLYYYGKREDDPHKKRERVAY